MKATASAALLFIILISFAVSAFCGCRGGESKEIKTQTPAQSTAAETEPAAPEKVIRKSTISPVSEEAGTPYVSEGSAKVYRGKGHGLTRALISAEKNPALPFGVSCYIGEDTVSAVLPAGIDTSDIVLTFTARGEVALNGTPLVSGETAVDLTYPAALTVTDSEGAEHSLTINVEALYTGLPSVALTAEWFGGIDSQEEYVNCTLYAGGGDTDIAPYSQSEAVTALGRAKGRGNTSWGFDKKGYTISLNEKTSFFGLEKNKKWVLVANYQDKTLMRNEIASELSARLGLCTMETRLCDLWYNGRYWGTYMLIEKIERGESRVDIPKYKTGMEPDEAGYLIEINGHTSEVSSHQIRKWVKEGDITYDPQADIYFFNGPWSGTWSIIDYPSNEDQTPEMRQYVYDYIYRVEEALENGDWATAKKYCDMDSFAEWYIVEDVMKSMDACFWCSVYMYIDGEGILHMGPVWDFDLSSGNCNYGECDTPEGDYLSTCWWYRHLLRMEGFREILKKTWKDFYPDIAGMRLYIDEVASMISISQKYNFERWRILGIPVGANPQTVADIDTFSGQVEYLKDFIVARTKLVGDYIKSLE